MLSRKWFIINHQSLLPLVTDQWKELSEWTIPKFLSLETYIFSCFFFFFWWASCIIWNTKLSVWVILEVLIFFLISPWKHMLQVQCEGLPMCINNICLHREIKKKYYVDTPFINLELWKSTLKRAKIRIPFSTSQLLVYDQLVVQNWWLTMKIWAQLFKANDVVS